jgi:CRISPR-associated endonuclease Csn1
MRRTHQRRSQRKRELVAELIKVKVGLFPSDLTERAKLEKTLEDTKDGQHRLGLYALRRRALNEAVSPHEFGRILIHLNQRRGFKSNRKTGQLFVEVKKPKKKTEEAEQSGEEQKQKQEKKMKLAIRRLQESIEEYGSRSLGEHLHRIGIGEVSLPQTVVDSPHDASRIRGRYLLRAMLEQEFDELWKKQQKHIPQLQDESLKARIRHIIFFQRPLRPSNHLIGQCECIPRLRRCLRADWYAQQFRILKEVNNLRIHNPDGSVQELVPEQRKRLVELLGTRERISFDEMRKMFGPYERQEFNLELGPRKKGGGRKGSSRKNDDGGASQVVRLRKYLKGNTIEAALHEAFGEAWQGVSEAQKAERRKTVSEAEDPDEVIRTAMGQWGRSAEEGRVLASAELPDGYMAYSLDAMKSMIVEFEKGLDLPEGLKEYEARERCGYNRADDWPAQSLLPLPRTRDGKPLVKNPVVSQALHEVRKVVNAIIREYGRPNRIIIEMSRELNTPLAQRMELAQAQADNRDDRERVKGILKLEFGVAQPTGTDVLAYRLWKQQNWMSPYPGQEVAESPYSGGHISQEHMRAFFNGGGVLEIDHILAYSRTLDDSQNNKCLCFAEENREPQKGERTPREWLEGTSAYEAMLQRVSRMKETGMPLAKRRKFSQKEVKLDDFVARQMNDTRYITREVRKYLQCLYAGDQSERDKRVWCVSYQAVVALRWRWGLDSILSLAGSESKNRLDLRHHAIDAIVVALVDDRRLHILANVGRNPDRRSRKLDEPWMGFREDVRKAVMQIRVSHRVERRVRGALHEETIYAETDSSNQFAYRKELKKITLAEVHRIRDEDVKRLIMQRLKEHGITLEKKKRGKLQDDEDEQSSKKPPASVWQKPLYMIRKPGRTSKRAAIIKKVRLTKPDESIRAIRTTVPLMSLTTGMVSRIVDEATKRVLVERLRERGIEPGSGDRAIPVEVWRPPLRIVQGDASKRLRRVDVSVTEEPGALVNGRRAFVKPGKNHHLCLFEIAGTKKRVCDVVSMLQAVERLERGQSVMQRTHPDYPNAKFVMSLSRGEMVLLCNKGRKVLCRYETAPSTTYQMVFREHCAAAVGKNGKITKRPNRFEGCKVTVDPLGRIRWAND